MGSGYRDVEERSEHGFIILFAFSFLDKKKKKEDSCFVV
jgi:hypothetical protein